MSGVVDPVEAEPFLVSVRPLEVVEERPDEVTLQGYTVGDGVLSGREMTAQVLDAAGIGDALVAGAQVFAYGLGLMANNNIHTFSYGYDKLRFIKPVFIGDTIYTIRTHLEKRPRYAEMGLVRVSYEVFKGEAELVLYTEHLQTVKYRDPAQWQDQFEKR